MNTERTNYQTDVVMGAIGLYPTGPYVDNREYDFLQIVSDDGQTYFAMHNGIKGIAPRNDANMEHWFLVAARGESLYESFIRTHRFSGTENEFLQMYADRLDALKKAYDDVTAAITDANEAASNANNAASTAGAYADDIRRALDLLQTATSTADEASKSALGAASIATTAAELANKAASSAEVAAQDTYAVRDATAKLAEKTNSVKIEALAAVDRINETDKAVKAAETNRVLSEKNRTESEILRAKSETRRAESETKRVDTESKRVDAESKRADAESKRVDAESKRADAESKRAKEHTDMIKDTESAINKTNTATDRATEAANIANQAADSVATLSAEVDKTLNSQDDKIEDLYAQSAYAYDHIAQRRHKRGTATPKLEAYGNIKYLRALPSLLGLGCYLVQPDRTKRKLDPTNHLKFDDGTPAKLDGTMGDYMWCWNAFYYAWWWEGDYYYEAVSLRPILGRLNYYIPAGGTSALGAGVMDRENNILCSVVSDDPRYRGGNNDDKKDGAYNSLLGKVASAYNAQTASTAARKKGVGWEASWFITNRAVEILYRIIMGTRHCQDAVNPEKDSNGLFQGGTGYGVCGVGSWWSDKFNYYAFIPTSFGIDKGDYTGELSYDVKDDTDNVLATVKVPCFFGLKNFYGHIGNIENGIVMNKLADGSGDIYVAPSFYAPYKHNSLDGLLKACHCPANEPKGWKYISELSMQYLCGMPTECNATDKTGFTDGFYNDNAVSGLRGSFRRGHAYKWGDAGLVYFYGIIAVLHTHAYWSLPLCFLEADATPIPKQF